MSRPTRPTHQDTDREPLSPDLRQQSLGAVATNVRPKPKAAKAPQQPLGWLSAFESLLLSSQPTVNKPSPSCLFTHHLLFPSFRTSFDCFAPSTIVSSTSASHSALIDFRSLTTTRPRLILFRVTFFIARFSLLYSFRPRDTSIKIVSETTNSSLELPSYRILR